MKKLAILFFATMLAGQVWANNYDFSAVCSSGQTLYYKITSSIEPYTAQVVYPNKKIINLNANCYYNYTKPTGSLTILEKVTYNEIEYTVTSIGDQAFYVCRGLTEVTIPESVTSIGEYAFSGCSGLTSVTIPNSATSIGEGAFYSCSGLTSVTIPNSVTLIGEGAFRECSGKIYCEEKNKPSGWQEYWNGFRSDNQRAIVYWGVKPKFTDDLVYNVINDSVLLYQIEIYQYKGDSITANIPSSVTLDGKDYKVVSIAKDAFKGYDNLDYTAYGNAFYIGNDENPYLILMEAKNTKITSVDINSRCQFIYGGAFSNCTSLTEISIPKSVINIGGDAFSGCTGLQKAEFASVADLCKIKFGNSYSNPLYQTHHLFINGEEVINVVIPDSVKSVGDFAFYGCGNLSSVTIGNSVETIGQYAFYACNGLTTISIPGSVKNIGNNAFNCNRLQKVEYASIESLCGISFGNNTANPLYCAHNLYVNGEKVINLVIPQSVKSIGYYAFNGCTSIASLVVSDSVETIGISAFSDCRRLASIDIPNSVESIGSDAFSGCSYLKSLSYNSNAIGANFNNISALESISIGDSIKAISGSEFNGCDNLVNVISMAAVPPTLNGDPYTFADTIWVPAASVEAYQNAPVWKRKEIMPLDYYTVKTSTANAERGAVSTGGQYAAMQAVTVYATPAENYHFKAWSDGNTENPRTIMIEGDVNVTAVFEGDSRMVNVSANSSAFGSVVGAESYHYGDTVTFTATPAVGYHFVGWSDSVTTNPRVWVVTEDSAFNAVFEINTYTIAASAENGSVSGADTYNYGSTATLTATPAEGYHFVKWSDDVTDNPRTITVNGDMQVAAEFEKNSENTNPGTAVNESAADNLLVYAHGNTIIVENATEEIRVYDAMGRLIVETPHCDVSTEIRVNTTGVYIVKVGNVAKRVIVN